MAKDPFEELGFVEFEDLGFEEDKDIALEEVGPLAVMRERSAKQKEREIKAQEIEAGKDTSFLDPFITRQARASFERGEVSAPLQAGFGILGTPARTLGSLFGKGDISDEQTGLFKDQRLKLQEKMSIMSNVAESKDQLEANLQAKRDEIADRTDLPQGKKRTMLRLLDEGIDNLDDIGLAQAQEKIVDNILLVSMSVAEDPMTLLEAGIGVTSKLKAAKPVGQIAEEGIKQEAKIASKAGRTTQEIDEVIALGGPEELGKRTASGVFLDEGNKLGITRESVNDALSKIVKPQEGVSFGGKFDEIPDAQLINIPEFDRLKNVEAGFQINAEDFVTDLFGSLKSSDIDKVLKDVSTRTEVDEILKQRAARMAEDLSKPITGDKVRDIISEINSLVDFSKAGKTDLESRLLTLKDKLKGRLSESAKATLGEEQTELYEDLISKANKSQRLKRDLLDEVLGKGKSQFNLGEVRLNDANDKLRKIVTDAGTEFAQKEGRSKMERLRKFDQVFGTNLRSQAIDFGFAKKINLFPTEAELGRVRDIAKQAKAFKSQQNLLPGGVGLTKPTVFLQTINFLKKLAGRDKSLKTAILEIQKLRNKDPRKRVRLVNALIAAGISEDLVSQAFPRE